MRYSYIIILFITTLFISCENPNYRSSVPSVPVNFTLNITSEYPHFIVDNGFQTITVTQSRYEREYVGYAGLLLWIAMDGNYHAADLCCPHCLKPNKPVEIDGIYAVCPICNEQFDLSYGLALPTQGFTHEPLRKYRTIINTSVTGLTLRVIN